MFKGNPHYNQYYGRIHHTDKKYKKLKRTECSGQKLEQSKKSFSRDSLSDTEINAYKRNLNFPNGLNKRKPQTFKLQCAKKLLEDSQKSDNILDQFKIYKPQYQNPSEYKKYVNFRKVSKKFVGLESEDQETNRYDNKRYENQYQKNEYFGESVKINNKNSSNHINRSRSQKSFKCRESKSPLRKILKSRSRQFLPSPVQKMCKIVKQQQKIKQQKKQIQKTLKQTNYYRSINELNDTYSQVNQNKIVLKRIKSQKNIYQLQGYQYEKNTHSNLTQRQQQLHKNKIYTHKFHGSKKTVELKRVKNDRETISHMKSLQKPKMSGSKIKKYFNKKEEKEKDLIKMKFILNDIGVRNHIQHNLHKIESQKIISHSNVSQDQNNFEYFKVSNSKNYKTHNNIQSYTQRKPDYSKKHERSSSINQNQPFQQYSDYGFQHHHTPKNSQISKKFVKTPQRVEHYDESQSSRNQLEFPAGEFIDNIRLFESSKYNKSQEIQAQISSNASIQQNINPPNAKFNPVNSQYLRNLSGCIINVKQPSNLQIIQIKKKNINLENNKNHKKPKQSILNKLKKDIEDDKLKKSQLAKNSYSKNSLRNSSMSKRHKQQSLISSRKIRNNTKHNRNKNYKQSDYMSQQDYLKISDRGKESAVDYLSNLIHSSPSHRQIYTNSNHTSQIQFFQAKSKNNKNEEHQMMSSQQKFGSFSNSQKSSLVIQRVSNSMINSNKNSQKINAQSFKNSNLEQKNNYFEKQKLKNQQEIQSNPAKKSLKFVRVTTDNKSANESVTIPKMQESNMDSMTDSNPNYSESATSFHMSSFKSNSSSSQSIKTKNAVQIPKFQNKKPDPIQEQQISQCQSQGFEQSVNMTSSQQISLKTSKKYSQPSIKDSSMSQNSPSNSKTNNRSSKHHLTSSQRNINSYQNSQLPSSSVTNSLSINSSSVSNSKNLSSNSNKLVHVYPKNNSLLFKKKKNFAQYTLNDVARYIEQHQSRVQAFYQYIDNCKNVYQQDYELQKTQFLSFLVLKKNLFQLNRAIRALQGKGQNVFNLTDIQIIDEVLQDYLDREQIKQQLNNLIKQQKQTSKQFQQIYKSLEKKYAGQKAFSLKLDKDDFSSQIIKKLGQQLNTLYEKWQRNKSDGDKITAKKLGQKYQKRMIQIIELIFLTSELDGNKIKACQLSSQTDQQFRSYYQKWFQRIIQTIQYFDSKSKCEAR